MALMVLKTAGVMAPLSYRARNSSSSYLSKKALYALSGVLPAGHLMARPAYGGRTTCESCPSIDVRQWHREGRLYPGQHFSCSWARGGEPAGSITVQVECAAVLLSYRSCYSGSDDWKSIQQRVPIRLTACHLGGVRPWFVCSVYSDGRYCGRRAAILYSAGELFGAAGVMAWPMKANSRRRCIAAWAKRGRSG